MSYTGMQATPYKHNRIPEIDVMRAIAILMIVLSHLLTYISSNLFGLRVVWAWSLGYLIIFGLGIFFFISGLTINLNYKTVRTAADVKTFFRKRTNRIYPLYLPAFVITLVGSQSLLYTSTTQRSFVTLAPSGIVAYLMAVQGPLIPRFVPSFFEFWFVGVIVMYYVLYLLLTYCSSNNIRRLISLSTVLFFALLTIKVILNTIDMRFFLYYFVFVGGVTTAAIVSKFDVFTYIRKHMKLILPAAMLLLVVLIALLGIILHGSVPSDDIRYYQFNSNPLGIYYDVGLFYFFTVLILLFVFLAFFSARFFASFDKLLHVFELASYAAYSVYLFHIPLLVVLRAFLVRLPFISSFGIDVLMIVVGLPVSFVIPYLIQRMADLFAKKIRPFSNSTS